MNSRDVWKYIGYLYIAGYAAAFIAIMMPIFPLGIIIYSTILLLCIKIEKETMNTPGFLSNHNKRIIFICFSGVIVNAPVIFIASQFPQLINRGFIDVFVIVTNLAIGFLVHSGSTSYNKGIDPIGIPFKK